MEGWKQDFGSSWLFKGCSWSELLFRKVFLCETEYLLCFAIPCLTNPCAFQEFIPGRQQSVPLHRCGFRNQPAQAEEQSGEPWSTQLQ